MNNSKIVNNKYTQIHISYQHNRTSKIHIVIMISNSKKNKVVIHDIKRPTTKTTRYLYNT